RRLAGGGAFAQAIDRSARRAADRSSRTRLIPGDRTMTSGNRPTPVNVLTGFLGSGKTTLLQRLLRSPRVECPAVLMNEFVEIGLDHLLVQQIDGSVLVLQSGCICCSIRDDLKSALR